MIHSVSDVFRHSIQNCEVHRTLLESFTSLALSIVYPQGRGSLAYSPPIVNKTVPPVDSHHRSYRLNVPVTRQLDSPVQLPTLLPKVSPCYGSFYTGTSPRRDISILYFLFHGTRPTVRALALCFPLCEGTLHP